MRERSTIERTGVALALACATFVLHVAYAGRFDFFRDELYFIVCGRHPAFGYVDQPPLVPLWAAASQAFGENLVLLRLPSALAGAATVYAVCALARLAGGGRFAQFLAGFAAAVAPMYLGLSYLLTTTVLDPLTWTLCAYLVARRILLDDRGAIVWLGVVAGIALEAKYSIPFYLAALTLGLLATPQRRIIATRETLIGTAIALALAAPSLIWQGAHGWPFLELLRNGAAGKTLAISPAAFLLQQVMVMNPLFAPLWLAGIAAPFLLRRLAALRALSIAFVLVTAVMIGLSAKDYYLAAAYGAMFALGGVALERGLSNVFARAAYVAAAAAVAALAAPLALPILDPPGMIAYIRGTHQAPSAQEKIAVGVLLPQWYADQFGWRALARTVAAAYAALPEPERSRTAVIARNYGEAAALDFFGRELGLPPALSTHNSYYLWGYDGYDGSSILRVNALPSYWTAHCREATTVATFGAPYAMPYETGRPIVLCRFLREQMARFWQDQKAYE